MVTPALAQYVQGVHTPVTIPVDGDLRLPEVRLVVAVVAVVQEADNRDQHRIPALVT